MARRYSEKFKFQVVMEVLAGDKSQAQVAKAYGVHPNTVSSWKSIFMEKGPEVFARDSVVSEYERRIADLE
ncbi:MAG: transposase, partial [Anaerolineae bacterium]